MSSPSTMSSTPMQLNSASIGGSRRRRRGGQYTPTDKPGILGKLGNIFTRAKNAVVGQTAGRRRHKRGGNVGAFDGNWNLQGTSKVGGRRRRRR